MFEAETDDLRTIKALPLWQSFLAAVIAPILIAIVFGILGARQNALLLQLELLLIPIAFCLTGILSRSKLLGLLSIFAAPISWVVLFILDMITLGFIINPYGLATGITTPMFAIFESGILGEIPIEADMILIIMIILDLFIVEFLALFLGFFLSTLATGFWTKQGELSIFSLIIKPIAAFFVILILVTVPLFYHGLFSFANGGIALAAGGAEFASAFGIEITNEGGGSGVQNGINITDPEEIEELSEAAKRAAQWFHESAIAFDQVQGNFYVVILTPFLPEDFQGINLQELPSILEISRILATLSDEIPSLLVGYYNLVEGFDQTFTILGASDLGGGVGGSINRLEAIYDPDFNDGLKKISNAIGNFSESKDGVIDALEHATDIMEDIIVDEEGELAEFVSVVGEAEVGYGIILEVASGALDFLNATYKTTLAVEDLGDSDFAEAHDWMGDAAIDLAEANDTLQDIDTEGLKNGSILPFYGTVEIIKDMTELLAYFARAATNGTECYMEIEDAVIAINDIDFAGGNLDDISNELEDISANVSETRITFASAKNNIGTARDKSDKFVQKDYGDIINNALKPMLIDFSNMLETFYTNVTEIENLIEGLDYTLASAYSFTEGMRLFNNTFNDLREAVGGDGNAFFNNFSINPKIDRSLTLMDFAINNATYGYIEVDNTTVISADITTDWKNTLVNPYPVPNSDIDAPEKSIAGLALGVKETIELIKTLTDDEEQDTNSALVNAFFDSMDEVGFDQIFGGGS
ncbi:MAG: hypothetical protein ACFFB5_03280 [Promethearchaeota archaeon]